VAVVLRTAGRAGPVAGGCGRGSGRRRGHLVVGQAPASTAWVDVVTADGEHHDATIGNGRYMAWTATPDSNDEVVEIDAHDSTGKVIASLADPSGLQVGSSAEPAST